MILNGCSLSSGGICKPYKACSSKSCRSASSCIPLLPPKVLVACARLSLAPHQYPPSFSKGFSFLGLSSASSLLLSGGYGGFLNATPGIMRRKEWPHFFRFHVVMGMLLDISLEVIGTISRWMPLAVYWGKVGMLLWTALTFAYLKEWPHFFRFHVVMGMLFDIALEVIGTISCWMPLAVYWGKVGVLFWTALAFAYLFTVLGSIRCALAGMYADITFVCDAAYIQYPMINESQHIGCNRWNYVSYSVLVEH